jgi:eukaryotic-like serine/threonine-protein kinase
MSLLFIQRFVKPLVTVLLVLSLPAVPLVWYFWYLDGGGFEAIYVAVAAVPAGLWAARRWLQQPADPAVEQLTPNALQNPRNRENLLNSVQTAWIDGVLHQSIHGQIIKLYLTPRPDAVGLRPWGLALKQAGQADQPLPTDYDLGQLFAESGRNLLILGQPGSGKTFTMLQLAESLLTEACRDPAAPLPIILNLSSWAQEKRPLTDWLAEELFIQYGVARRVTRAGIAHNQFLYLLDGLDEVAAAVRDDCVAAINAFKAEHPAEMVICSRSEEYAVLQEKLRMGTAVEVQPLTPDQIDHYLSQEGLQLQAVRTTLKTDPDLRELAETPLMLSIMTLAYQGMRHDELKPLADIEARRRHIFDHYIAKNFERRPLPASSPYTQEQAKTWLANLARGMVEHEQSVFYIEKLQPSWLGDGRWRRYYQPLLGLVIGLIAAVISAVISITSLSLAYNFLDGNSNGNEILSPLILAGLMVMLTVGSVLGLIMSSDFQLEESEQTNQRTSIQAKLLWYVMRRSLVFGLIAGSIAGFAFNSFLGFIFGLAFGFVSGLSGIVVLIIQHPLTHTIEKITLHIPSRATFASTISDMFVYGQVFGLVFGLIPLGVLGLVLDFRPLFYLSIALYVVLSLLAGMIIGLYRIIGATISVQHLVQSKWPNQGTWHSGWSSIRVGLPIGMISGVVVGILTGLLVGLVGWVISLSVMITIVIDFLSDEATVLFDGLDEHAQMGCFGIMLIGLAFLVGFVMVMAVFVGILSFIGGIVSAVNFSVVLGILVYGGAAFIGHYTLRWLLARAGILPYPFRDGRLTAYLDAMQDRILLRRVGGGWLFVHRSLLEHFARMKEDGQ